MVCQACGANLQPGSLSCPFCKTATPMAEQQAQEEALAHARFESQQRETTKRTAETEVNRSATMALIWSLAGLLCCFVFPSIVALVLAIRARKLAKERSVVIPGSATIALVLASVEIVALLGFTTWMVLDFRRVAHEREALQARVAQSAAAAKLDQPTACTLTHIALLTDGYQGHGATSIEDFDCPGKLTQTGDRASLEDVHFKASTDKHIVTACFKHGARWIVDGFREGKSCTDPADGGASSARAAPTSSAKR